MTGRNKQLKERFRHSRAQELGHVGACPQGSRGHICIVCTLYFHVVTSISDHVISVTWIYIILLNASTVFHFMCI